MERGYPQADLRQYAPATQRNREPILTVLKQHLPATGTVLEIASGTGEHAVFFSSQLAPRKWLPTDVNPLALDSIAAWREHSQPGIDGVYPPIFLDVTVPQWPVEVTPPEALQETGFEVGEIGAIANMNMIHISPWSACEGLMNGAGRILPPGGVLYLYGPFQRDGKHTAPSNAAFDQSLRSRNPEWGVRALEAVTALAAQQGLALETVISMPANNLSVIFRKGDRP